MPNPIEAHVVLPFAMTRPIHIASVSLKARDVAGLADFYRAVLGLETLSSIGGSVGLGAGGVSLLEIDPLGPGGLADDPKSAGLYHTAFLMPTRADLGRWIAHASSQRFRVDGMADHLVSEALYMTDPEGNGVEIYSDRPHEGWKRDAGAIRMASDPLDVNAIVRSAKPEDGVWLGAPAGLRIGHVHLRVGDPTVAQSWWTSELGFDVVTHFPGATFMSTGGYHHHIGANSWQSRGAGPRNPARSGLQHVTLTGTGVASDRELVDPWGTVIRLTPVGA